MSRGGVHSRAIHMLTVHRKKEQTPKDKKDDFYRRLTINSFISLVLQSESVQLEESMVLNALHLSKEKTFRKICLEEDSDKKDIESSSKDHPPRPVSPVFQGVIRGIGEADRNSEPEPDRSFSAFKKQVSLDKPYLLLDVRDEDEYKAGHIITALNYPSMLLSRAVNYETAHLAAFKNKSGKLIIVYDSLEKEAPRVAATLMQRGYDNIALLAGGLSTAIRRYPNGLFVGQVPQELLLPQESRNKKMTKMKRFPSVPNFADKLRTEFTAEDLEFLREQLQYNLLPRGSRSRVVRETETARIRNEETFRQQKKNRTILSRQHSYN